MSVSLAEPRPSSSSRRLAEDDGELQQDADFWFADGSIVLIAENATFRVHQGVLSRHSEVFRELFTVPQPHDEQSVYGCPVVRLYDSPIDLRYLLRVLYDGRKHSVKHEPRLEFSEVEAVVRLAHKYELNELREEGVQRIMAVFTDDFTVYSRSDEVGRPRLFLRPSDAISVVKLAHLTQELTLLPLALYDCARLSATQLMEGVSLANGTIDRLSQEDLARCIDGKSVLAHKRAMVILGTFVKGSHERVHSLQCATNLRVLLLSLTDKLPMGCHPLKCLRDYIDKSCEWGKLCDKCRQVMHAKHLESRREIWRDLPSYFGLDDWDKLRTAGASA
ncbi:hypothetical protein BKA93DRAFT_743329 [Sparassis latifolia]